MFEVFALLAAFIVFMAVITYGIERDSNRKTDALIKELETAIERARNGVCPRTPAGDPRATGGESIR